MAAWAIPATSRSSTSIVTTAVIVSPRAARRSRSARSPASCSAIWGRGSTEEVAMEGGCACRNVRYRLHGKPMMVHACHCTWCQRETGTVHALNAMYEFDRVEHLKAEPEIVDTPSASGQGQRIARCPICKVAVWSNYPGSGAAVRFVRVGTMDDPSQRPP